MLPSETDLLLLLSSSLGFKPEPRMKQVGTAEGLVSAKSDSRSVDLKIMPQSPDQYGAWAWVVLCACATCVMMTSGLAILAGLFQQVLLDEMGGDVVVISWITSIFSSLLQLGGAAAGVVCSVFGCRVSIMTGGVLLSLGLLASSFCHNTTGLIFSLGLSSGLGLGLIYTPAVVMVNLCFVRYRPVASGSVLAAGGVGISVMPIVCRSLLDAFSWRQTFVFLACCSAQLVVAGALLFPIRAADRKPLQGSWGNQTVQRTSTSSLNLHDSFSDCHAHMDKQPLDSVDDCLQQKSDGNCKQCRFDSGQCLRECRTENIRANLESDKMLDENDCQRTMGKFPRSKRHRIAEQGTETITAPRQIKTDISEHGSSNSIQGRHKDWRRFLTALKNPAVIIICLQLFLTNASTGILLVHFVEFCLERGSDLETVSLAFSLSGILLTLSRILVGFLSQNSDIDPLSVYVGLCLVTTFIKILIPFIAVNRFLQVLLLLGQAVYGGSSYAVLTEITIPCTGTQVLSLVFGIEMISAGAGFLVAPPIAAWLFVLTGSYGAVMLLSGVLELLAAFVAMGLSVKQPVWKPPDLEMEIDITSSCETRSLSSEC